MTLRRMRSAMASSALSRCMKQRSRFGLDGSHWRTGRRGDTWSHRCAAISAMRRVVHEGQTPRPLQEKATK